MTNVSPRPRRRWLRILLGALLLLGLGVLLVLRALVPPDTLPLPERGAVLGDVTVVNPGAGRAEHRSVSVEGATIAAVREPRREDPARFAGRFVLPGLVDMHVHFPPPTGLGQTELFAFLFLAHGVTSVRDCGDVDGTATTPARGGVREGLFPGPRVFACGYFVDGPEPLWPNTLVARTAEEGTAAVQRIAAEGFDCVKVYDGLPPEALAGVKAEAAKHGLPVIGHVPRATPWEQARLDDVQHLTGFGNPGGDTRPFPQILELWRQLDDAALAEAARRTAALGIAQTPTLIITEQLRATRDLARLQRRPEALLLPRLYRDAVWTRDGSPILARFTDADYALLDEVAEKRKHLVRALRDAGARIHAGSDVLNPFVVPGVSLHQELRLLAGAGLTSEEAWVAATSAPGEMLGRRNHAGLGTVAEGAPADLLVFREDPTQNLAALDSLEAVIADGRLYLRDDLDRQLAVYQGYANGRIFDRVSVAVTKRMLARIFAKDGGE